jgi:transcriptional regulator with XRE-family HTH domain
VAVGARIRALRHLRGWTLQQLSTASGVSTAMLSKVERDKRNPTIAVAWRIADALGVSPSRLLTIDRPRAVTVIRKRQRKLYRDPETGFERHVLTPTFPTRGIEFLSCILPPGGGTGPVPAHQRSFEECILVTRGSLMVRVGATRRVLRQGDAIYYEPKTEHRLVNVGRSRCEFYLLINSDGPPPTRPLKGSHSEAPRR